MKPARAWFIATSAAAVLLACLPGCGGSNEEEPARPEVEVGIAVVERDSIAQTLEVTGRLAAAPGGSASLTAPMDAVVTRVAVELGDSVRVGGLLLLLDAPDLAAQASALRAEAEAAEADAERKARLFDEGIVARRDAEERSAAARSARASLEAAESLLARTHVRSPLGGVVQRVLVSPGERVAAGQLLVEIVDARILNLVVEVSARDIVSVHTGQDALVTVEGAESPWPARVHAVAPALDGVSNMGQVLLRLESPGTGLRPGAGASGRIVLDVAHEVLVVPDSALVYVGEQLHIFVVGADSIAHALPVDVGARTDGRAEVRGELQPGDRVVTSGAYGLPDSTRVIPAASHSE